MVCGSDDRVGELKKFFSFFIVLAALPGNELT
jgi:hypothetical protein